MSDEEVRAVADGRIFTGDQAHAHGLVDELGDLESAIRGAAEMAGIKGKPPLVRKKKKPRIWELLESRLTQLLPLSSRAGSYPALRLLYLWG